MITPVFAAEASGSRIYQIGRVGLDSNIPNQDTGGAFTGVLKTERISPLGLNALLMFRRVACRIWLTTTSYKVTMTIYVNGVQTQNYVNGVLQNQVIVFNNTLSAGTVTPIEVWIEGSLQAAGTYIEVQLSVLSTDIPGTFLPAEMEVHFFPLRTARERTAQSS